jgi:hypothetical protein
VLQRTKGGAGRQGGGGLHQVFNQDRHQAMFARADRADHPYQVCSFHAMHCSLLSSKMTQCSMPCARLSNCQCMSELAHLACDVCAM